MHMGRHSGEGEAQRGSSGDGRHSTYDGRHRADDRHRETRPEYSGFNVDSPERDARGVGNRQTGGRDD